MNEMRQRAEEAIFYFHFQILLVFDDFRGSDLEQLVFLGALLYFGGVVLFKRFVQH
jgi:hypothetical protein